MYKKYKDEKYKKLIRLSHDYVEASQNCRKNGNWADVEPYQRGWTRFYVLRDDAKNRQDVRFLRQVLDLVNNYKFCRKQDFKYLDYKTNTYISIPQPLKILTKQEYEKLSEKLKSYFAFYEWIDYNKYANTKTHRSGYSVREYYRHYFVFSTEPNIITQEWKPSSEWESRYAEIRNYINKHNLWVHISHAKSKGCHYRDSRLTVYQKNKRGMLVDITEELSEYNEDVA